MQTKPQSAKAIKRELFVVTAAYLSGIFLAGWRLVPIHNLNYICAFCVFMGVLRLWKRQSALFCILIAMLISGYCAASQELRIRDEATQPGVYIEGVIAKKIKDLRVMLTDVSVEGVYVPERPVMVTLMLEKDENGIPIESREVKIGQHISGMGRLFEPDGRRNPGDTDDRLLALIDGYELSGYILPGWTVEGEAIFSFQEVFRQVKMAFSRKIEALFEGNAPFFQAILIGDRTNMEPANVQAMRLSGIVHLLTISGMHLTMIAHAITGALRRLPVGRKRSFAIKTFLLMAYTGVTGCAAGTVRACIMAILKEIALMTGRRYDSLTALSAAALIMTLAKPLWALGASFQFSFFVVLGIHLLHGQLRALLKQKLGRMRFAGGAVSMSACAQISALPMQLMLYGYVPLLALPMNLICGAFMPVFMLGGWCVLLLGVIFPQIGHTAAQAVGFGAAWIERLSALVSQQRWAVVRLPAPYAWTIVIAAWLFVAASRKFRARRGKRAACVLLSVALLFSYLPRLDSVAQYVQLDVGQGDGAVFRRGRNAVLVDVGAADEYAMLRYLRNEGLFVETLILSHLDEDHAGALGVLLDSEIEVGRIVLPTEPGEEHASQAVRDALKKAREKEVPIDHVKRGDTILTKLCTFEVLSPCDGFSGSNERSLALYTELDGLRILTLGDLPSGNEMEGMPECDLLKVAHHGSAYATSRTLIETVKPQMAVISVGRNSYGHPHERVLSDLKQSGVHVFRTDASGCVSIRIGKRGYQVKPFIK